MVENSQVTKFFTSGADLKRTSTELKLDKGLVANPVGVFMRTLIRFPKPLVAAVNGPAIGIGSTLLPFADLSYAHECAYFFTPFSRVALAPEMCSSYTFPRVLGPSTANEMLLFSKQLSAHRACELGFVSKVFSGDQNLFMDKVLAEVRAGLIYPILERTLPLFKSMIRKWDVEFMDQLIAEELNEIQQRMDNGDVLLAVQTFMQRKSRM